MKFGYARISTKHQAFDLQVDALKKAGCEKIFKDTASGTKEGRHDLNRLLSELRPKDIIIVWKMDRLGHSLKHLVELVDQFHEREIGLISLNDPIDTTTSQGKLIYNIFASLAEFERDVIRERTKAGLEAARARGRKGGRPKGLSKQAEATACAAETLYKEQSLSVYQICIQLNISKATLYSYLRHRKVPIGLERSLPNK